MTPGQQKIIIGAAVGLVTAVVTDLRSFAAARKADRTVTFDWALAASQWLTGALTGATTGAGIGIGAGDVS